jgi:uncharacterized membrane protein
MRSEKLGRLLGRFRENVLDLFNKIRLCASRIPRIDLFLLIVLIAILLYGSIFSYFTILKHNVFQSYAWDLGLFNQALYTTLHNGKLLYYTAELYFSPTGSFFAVHFSPILFFVLPFYAIYSSPTTLLVIQSFALALGAIPLYLLSKKLLNSNKAACILALIYLLYPALQGANWFDFHTPALFPFMFFFLCYFMVTKRWKFYFSFVLFTLMIQEQAVFAVLVITIFYFLRSKSLKSLFKFSKPLKMTENLASTITLLMCGVYYAFSIYVKSFFAVNPKYVELLKATSAYSVLGVKGDPLLFPFYVLSNPQNGFNALMYDSVIKVFYIFLLFGPLLFVSFRSKLVIGILALLSLFLFSNYRPYYEIGNQYPLYVLPLIFIAAIYGLKKFQIRNHMRILKIMLIVTLLFTITVSPLSPLATPLLKEGALWYPEVGFTMSENSVSLNALVNQIPPNASVLAQNHVFPHVSSRINAYVLPLFNDTDYVGFLMNNSEYILIDLMDQDSSTVFVLNQIAQNNSYGVYALGNNSILFKRGFQGEPMFAHYAEYRVFSAYKDLISAPFSQIVSDLSSASGKVVMCPKGTTGRFVYGPYTYLIQGSYEVTFEVKDGEHNDSLIGKCDFATNIGTSILAKKDVHGFELKPNEWTNITLTVNVANFMTTAEFRTFSYGIADIYIDRVFVHRVAPNGLKILPKEN